MPTNTSSPLGLLNNVNDIQYQSGFPISSIFSSYQSNGVKHQLRENVGKNSGISPNFTPILSNNRHSNNIYDISTKNIIDTLLGIDHLKLSYADFAYLKNFGVYPNNRLFIARRFPQPVVDDLYSTTDEIGQPLSTVIGYLPAEDEEFIKLTFSEEWGDAEVSFKDILNSLGKDFGWNEKLGGGMGSVLEGAAGIIPLPGATLLLQRKIMASLGLFGEGVTYNRDKGQFVNPDGTVAQAATIPQGDPNLIKQAKNRSLIEEDSPGSGLNCKVQVTLKTVYEQKFINGVDPTLVFMDIVNNVLNMGTSPATFYLGKQTDAAGSIDKFFDDFMKDPSAQIMKFINSIISAFKEQLDRLDSAMRGAANAVTGQGEERGSLTDAITNSFKEAVSSIPAYVKDFIKAKYKVKFMGIVNALTGGPSTPWHITIGNPMRPIFCSGDMLCQDVTLSLGPQLSFNDLPTFIEVEIKLESARNIGLQEIFGKFNSGGIRTYRESGNGEYMVSSAKTFWTADDFKLSATQSNPSTQEENRGQESNSIDESTNSSNRETQESETKVPEVSVTQITPSVETKEQTNPDASSSEPVIPSGSDSQQSTLRTDETQNMTGETEGFTNQTEQPIQTPNEGINTRVI